MASWSPASTSTLCHSSRALTGNPAIRTPAFLVRRRLVLELASPERERERERGRGGGRGRGREPTCIFPVELVKVSDLKEEEVVWELRLHSMELSHEARSPRQSRVEPRSNLARISRQRAAALRRPEGQRFALPPAARLTGHGRE